VDEQAFTEKYNYDNLKMVTVVNPTSDDFTFDITMETSVDISNGQMKSETRQYVVKAGDKLRLPGVAANLYLDQMAKKIAQDEDRFSLYPDFAERAKYYDDLIIDVDDLLGVYQTLPQYDEKPVEEANKVEEPFAQIKETKVEQSQIARERSTGAAKATTERAATVDSKAKQSK